MDWSSKETNTILNLLIVIGALVTAWATTRQFFLSKRIHLVSAPTVTARTGPRDKSGQFPIQFSVNVDAEHETAWQIKSVMVWPPWHPLIGEITSVKQDQFGQPRHQYTDKWARRLTFDPPVQSRAFVAKSDCPNVLQIRCELVSRADAKIKSFSTIRFRIKD